MTGGGFLAKYRAAAARNHSLLCVGLDPDPARIPEGVETGQFLSEVIDATSDLVCCYKPNIAFFERRGEAGMAALRRVIAAVPRDVPVLLDAKRGDVGSTAAAYASALFDELGADAVTASPYLGGDALEPFFAYEGRHTFVLCRTSNPGASDLQDLLAVRPGSPGEGARPLYEHVALLARSWNRRGNVGLVVGATYPAEAARIRALCPEMLFLMPGAGAQGGDVDAAVRAAVDAGGGGVLVNASRAVLYAGEGRGPPAYAAAAREAATELREAINAARGESGG